MMVVQNRSRVTFHIRMRETHFEHPGNRRAFAHTWRHVVLAPEGMGFVVEAAVYILCYLEKLEGTTGGGNVRLRRLMGVVVVGTSDLADGDERSLLIVRP